MAWLNYHHLLYFYVVAKEGSIVAASKTLRLAHPTISGQIHTLEAMLGEKLFRHVGRNLEMTEAGRLAYRYADEMFSLGGEFLDAVKGRPTASKPLRLVVGVAGAVPPSLVRRFLEPARRMGAPVQLVCRADRSVPEFVAEVGRYTMDLILSDGPLEAGSLVRAFSHLLGECGTSLFAKAPLAAQARRDFPCSLEGLPFLMPSASSTVRRALEEWLTKEDVKPNVVAECDDSGLLWDFGRQGLGVFAAGTVMESEIVQKYRVRVVGRVDSLRQRFYAISSERKIQHPAVVAICKSARSELFAPVPSGVAKPAPVIATIEGAPTGTTHLTPADQDAGQGPSRRLAARKEPTPSGLD